MPKQSRQARQARSQRQSGNRTFDSGLIEDLVECALDPGYEPTESDGNIDSSDGSTLLQNVGFSLAENDER